MAVVKVIKIVGSSPESWAQAAAAAVREASRTIRNITGFEGTDFTGVIDEKGNVTEYRCTVNIAFRLESGGDASDEQGGRSGGRGGSGSGGGSQGGGSGSAGGARGGSMRGGSSRSGGAGERSGRSTGGRAR